MQFNSLIFIFLFLPIVLLGWHGLNRIKKYKLAMLFLIGISIWFYGHANPVYLLLITSSIAVNYAISFWLEKKSSFTKPVLIIGIMINVGALAYFKYRNFFISNINSVFDTSFTVKKILLPLGISFFTLQQIAYIVDRYRGEAPHYGLVEYSAFVMYFPKIMSGPIVYHDELIPQFKDESRKKFDIDMFIWGLFRFIYGMAKKVLIADTLAYYVDYGVGNVFGLDTLGAWVVALSYSLELYFDFSGYSDMAIGISNMLGITLPENFNAPYKARTLKDFWRRWHISLTRFLTKYIYIPLGGNRKGYIKTIINTLIVFFISGLWHGANWNFIIWGVAHGIAILISGAIHKKSRPNVFSHAITMLFVVAAWGVFRIEDFYYLKHFLIKMFTLSYHNSVLDIASAIVPAPELYVILQALESQPFLANLVVMILEVAFIALSFILMGRGTLPETFSKKKEKIGTGYIVFTALVFVYCILSFSHVTTFLYFSF